MGSQSSGKRRVEKIARKKAHSLTAWQTYDVRRRRVAVRCRKCARMAIVDLQGFIMWGLGDSLEESCPK